jgi:hypothetical protein
MGAVRLLCMGQGICDHVRIKARSEGGGEAHTRKEGLSWNSYREYNQKLLMSNLHFIDRWEEVIQEGLPEDGSVFEDVVTNKFVS